MLVWGLSSAPNAGTPRLHPQRVKSAHADVSDVAFDRFGEDMLVGPGQSGNRRMQLEPISHAPARVQQPDITEACGNWEACGSWTEACGSRTEACGGWRGASARQRAPVDSVTGEGG